MGGGKSKNDTIHDEGFFPHRRDNRLRLTHVRRGSLSRVYPAKARTVFSSLEEQADRCRLGAKICLASAIGFPIDPEWGENLNMICPKRTIVQSDKDEDEEEMLLGEEESEACLQKCDSILKDLTSRLKDANSHALTVAVSFNVYRLKEFAEATVTIRFRKGSFDGRGCGWACAGITCIAAVASVLRRSRCHGEGIAVMNLRNHCYDVGKTLMPQEESDMESSGDMDSATDESDVDEGEGFVPVAQDILDLMQEVEDDETAQSTSSSESDLDS